jgi:hypothetical protein
MVLILDGFDPLIGQGRPVLLLSASAKCSSYLSLTPTFV